MRRINRLTGLLLFIIVAIAQSASAENPSISIANTAGIAGQNVIVNVSLVNNGNPFISVANFEITYDPNKLSGNPTAAIGSGAYTAGKSLSYTVGTGSPSKLNLLVGGGDAVISDGVLATISFPLSTSATGIMPLTFFAIEANDANGNVVTISTTVGSVTIM